MISALIITRDEANNIGRCLQSLQGVADEVLVLDSGSTDDTIAIARQHGATVTEVEWRGYSATKNYGNQLVSFPYILSIDADEALSEPLKASILSAKPHLTGAYSFPRLTYYCGKPIRHCGWYPDVKVRIFPKGKAHWEGEIHEKLVLETALKVQRLNGDLFHYSINNREDHIARAQKYAQLAAQQRHSSGKAFSWWRCAFGPTGRFVRMYVWKAGFLDGIAGWHVCRISAMAVRWRCRYLQLLKGAH